MVATTRGAVVAVAMVFMFALNACGGGSSKTTAPTALPSSSTTVSAPATTIDTVSRTTPTISASTGPASVPFTSTPVTIAGLSRCPTSHLAATDDGGQGAGGTYFGRVVFRNISQQTCYLEGFPGLLHLGADGLPHPTAVVRRGKAMLVTLAPQGYASFAYSAADGPFGEATTCPSPAHLEVTPPNAFDYIVVVDHMPDCGGNIQVSAVLPGRVTDYVQALT